ncbi:MAG: hypothetical protein EOO61_15010, partial [Hymenobacter sp.]
MGVEGQYRCQLFSNWNERYSLAIGRLARKYRLLLEKDDGEALTTLVKDESFIKMTDLLAGLGYKWLLQSSNPLTNSYDLFLEKAGNRFHLSAGSSGEKEIVTYILAVFALDIRDALIVVDEPELHLHPRWQQTLLQLFEQLARSTGNQFLLATHSPNFISPTSIQYVSRVHSEVGGSRITPIDVSKLPDPRKMLNLINSQNNEKIFFADRVLLVEGVTDKIFMEAVIHHLRGDQAPGKILEVVNVDGKALFAQYQQLLEAGKVETFVMADLDYLDTIGGRRFAHIYAPEARKIKKDVVDNPRSLDADRLVNAIDNAMKSGDWGEASDVWDYIKGRKRRSPGIFDDKQLEEMGAFIKEKAEQKTFILSKGTLEAYLPSFYRSKNVERLVGFVSSVTFWEDLLPFHRDEIEQIGKEPVSGAAGCGAGSDVYVHRSRNAVRPADRVCQPVAVCAPHHTHHGAIEFRQCDVADHHRAHD